MFKEYLERYREIITENNPNNGICFDGVVDEKQYFSREKRLMFLLKETNGNDNNGDKNDVLTDWNEMDEYLDDGRRKGILHHQINTLQPTLVFCGGTFDFAKKIFDNEVEESTKNGVRFFEMGATVFVNCYHPSRPGWSRENSFNHANNIFKTFLLDD